MTEQHGGWTAGVETVNKHLDLFDKVVKLVGLGPHVAGSVTVKSPAVDWRSDPHMNAALYHPIAPTVLSFHAHRDDLDADQEYSVPIRMHGRFSHDATPPAITDCYFYPDIGEGRVGDDTSLTLDFNMEEGEIGTVGSHWAIPFTVDNGVWHVREDLVIYLTNGNGYITNEGTVIWEGLDVHPASGTSRFGMLEQPWEAGFYPHSPFGTGASVQLWVHNPHLAP